MKKAFLFYLLGMLTISVNAQNSWEKIDSPTSHRLTSVVFSDSLNGWAAGDSGIVIHTADGGKSWETQYHNDSLSIVNLCFLDAQYGFASASSSMYEPFGSFLLKTTNGGESWSGDYMRIGELFVNYVCFLDSLKGFAVGYPGFFMRTSDGGESWRPVTRDSSIYAGYPPYKIKFLNETYGYACGGVRDVTGVIWRTTDGGLSWDTVVDTSSAPPEPLFALQIFDSLNVIAMGGDPEYGASTMRTSDAGNFWQYDTLRILWYPLEVGFRTASEGWAPMGPKLGFLYSSNAGVNWSLIPTPDSAYVTNIKFPDSSHGYAVGINGTILKYTYQKPNEVIADAGEIGSFHLGQNYPNPFNPTTSISYQVGSAGMVTLKVYNILGKEIASLINEYKPAGSYSVEFDGSNLSSGVYFYRLEEGAFTDVKKMILLR